MKISQRREAPLLFLGDILFFSVALYGTLVVRYSDLPNFYYLSIHFVPFALLFLASTLVFFIAGLYEKHTLVMKEGLPMTIFYAQVANIMLAAAFFFLVPFFHIQPKGFLFIYLLLSVGLISFWRMYLFPLLSLRKSESAILFGSGEEAEEIYEEVNGNTRYSVTFTHFHKTTLDQGSTPDTLASLISSSGASVVVMPSFFFKDSGFSAVRAKAMRDGVRFIDQADIYEELFDRVSFASVDERVLRVSESLLYTALKRIMDIVLSLFALILLFPALLVVALILKIGEGKNAFIFQERVGKNNVLIKIIKFRTMLFDDAGDPEKQKKNRVTTLGAFLRKTQIDEMPQFWNVLMGELSLIGPRPEIPSLVSEYEKQIPYYGARHLLQPGISGWAQIKHASPPKWKLDVEATRNKLSYDLYYLKKRSIILDSIVILRTIQILLSRAGK
ncbi:sugar transferase [Patescibacteria group bacterium]|nr:sugar transferase [Patescibacteria group bacterium]